jgi:hypothetical protein
LTFAWAALALGFASALVIAADTGCALGDIGGEWLVLATAWMIGSTAELGPSTSSTCPSAS